MDGVGKLVQGDINAGIMITGINVVGGFLIGVMQQLGQLIRELTKRGQLVLSLYYEQELTMKMTAEVMQITEGQVSQLHTQAQNKLRRKFREQAEPMQD